MKLRQRLSFLHLLEFLELLFELGLELVQLLFLSG